MDSRNARHSNSHFDALSELETLRHQLETTLDYVSESRQMIAETKELMTKVDRLLENDNWMRRIAQVPRKPG